MLRNCRTKIIIRTFFVLNVPGSTSSWALKDFHVLFTIGLYAFYTFKYKKKEVINSVQLHNQIRIFPRTVSHSRSDTLRMISKLWKHFRINFWISINFYVLFFEKLVSLIQSYLDHPLLIKSHLFNFLCFFFEMINLSLVLLGIQK